MFILLLLLYLGNLAHFILYFSYVVFYFVFGRRASSFSFFNIHYSEFAKEHHSKNIKNEVPKKQKVGSTKGKPLTEKQNEKSKFYFNVVMLY
jgi:hypothetical protein